MSETSPHPADRVKVAHLVSGLVLVGISATWALHAAGVLSTVGIGVVLPLVLVLAGVAGLAAMLAVRTRTAATRQTAELETEPEEDR